MARTREDRTDDRAQSLRRIKLLGGNAASCASVILVALLVMLMPGYGATFSASLDRPALTLGESATLSLAFEGAQPASPPIPAQVPNLQVTYIGPSSQFSVINGQVSSSVTYNFRVTPQAVGNYLIPAVTAEVSGEKLTSNPVPLSVTQPTAPPAQAIASGARLAFMRLVLPKKEFYVGEAVIGQLQVFLNQRVREISGFQITSTPEGFNLGKIAEGRRGQMQISNTVYTVIPLNILLTPVKAGKFDSGPITATAVLSVQTGNRRRDPFFERFGMRDPFDMLGGVEQQQLTLATEAETLNLLPLPKENAPPSFNGAIGNYSMNVTAGPTNLAAGDPVTVKVQISGRGPIEGITLPPQPGWEDFKTFPPSTKVELTDQFGLQGTKTFEQIISPQTADIKAVPPVGFSFFDPEARQYRTLTHPPIPLVVSPGGPATALVRAEPRAQAEAPLTPDIVPGKQRLGTLAQVGTPLIQQPWFIAMQALPALAFVLALVWRRQTDSLARNPRLRRQRETAILIANGLKELHTQAAEKQSDQFFANVLRLLQEQIGERLDLPSTSITEAVIEERLRPRGVPEPLLSRLEEIFNACNVARYAPLKTAQELEAFIPKVEQILRELAALE